MTAASTAECCPAYLDSHFAPFLNVGIHYTKYDTLRRKSSPIQAFEAQQREKTAAYGGKLQFNCVTDFCQ